MTYFLPSIRLWLVTLLVCSVGYALFVFGFAQIFAPRQANGSLVERDGRVIGSALIAQEFTSPRYFWPRPSAVDYDAMGAGGSNLSPTSDALAARAAQTIAKYDATEENPIPADLVAASGGGLDPHISLAGALYQLDRVAAARKLKTDEVRTLVEEAAFAPGAVFAPEPIVNVLQLNLALDAFEQ